MPKKRRYLARLLDLHDLAALSREMERIEVDSGGVPVMAPKGVYRNILLEGISVKAANVLKQEILARGGDAAVPYFVADMVDTTCDVVLLGNLVSLRSFVAKCYRNPVFDLPAIADAVQEVLVHTVPGYIRVARNPKATVAEFDDDLYGGRIPGGPRSPGAPTLVDLGPYHWEFGKKTYVMGIVNATTDSFSDDGLDGDVEALVRRAHQMVADGADIIDVGGESSERRGHEPVTAREEIEHIVPVIRRLRETLNVPISVDTWKAEVAAAALAAGAQMINDVGAMRRDPAMRDVVAQSGAPIVVMHSQEGTAYRDIVGDIAHFFEGVIREAMAAGIKEEQIALDAGFGFGKSVHQDLLVTRRLREFTSFGRPILHAPSRKRTIGRVLGYPDTVEERLLGTGAAVAIGIQNGADIVRVHDVLDMARCARMTDALVRGYDGPDE